jgi:hypothetical protein
MQRASILIIFTLLISLGLSFAATADDNTVRIVNYQVIENSMFQRPYGKNPKRPDLYVSPTFVAYTDAGWKLTDILPQLERADFLLQQCGIGIENPDYFEVTSADKTLADSFLSEDLTDKDYSAPIKARLGPLNTSPALKLPLILLLNDRIGRKYDTGGVSISSGKTPEVLTDYLDGTIMIAKSEFDANDFNKYLAISIVTAMNFMNGAYVISTQNLYNVLAHELVHTLSRMSHEDRMDNLMNSRPGQSGYLSDAYCEAMRKSALLKSKSL